MSAPQKALASAWGAEAPEWIQVLASECARSSQATVGQRIGYSASTVNQVLKRTYQGNLRNVRAKVEGAFMGRTVECPVLGRLNQDACIDHQARPFAATNSQRVRLYRACRSGCPHSKLGRIAS